MMHFALPNLNEKLPFSEKFPFTRVAKGSERK